MYKIDILMFRYWLYIIVPNYKRNNPWKYAFDNSNMPKLIKRPNCLLRMYGYRCMDGRTDPYYRKFRFENQISMILLLQKQIESLYSNKQKCNNVSTSLLRKHPVSRNVGRPWRKNGFIHQNSNLIKWEKEYSTRKNKIFCIPHILIQFLICNLTGVEI